MQIWSLLPLARTFMNLYIGVLESPVFLNRRAYSYKKQTNKQTNKHKFLNKS